MTTRVEMLNYLFEAHVRALICERRAGRVRCAAGRAYPDPNWTRAEDFNSRSRRRSGYWLRRVNFRAENQARRA